MQRGRDSSAELVSRGSTRGQREKVRSGDSQVYTVFTRPCCCLEWLTPMKNWMEHSLLCARHRDTWCYVSLWSYPQSWDFLLNPLASLLLESLTVLYSSLLGETTWIPTSNTEAVSCIFIYQPRCRGNMRLFKTFSFNSESLMLSLKCGKAGNCFGIL